MAETPNRATTEALEADNFIETYQIIAEWIRFADAKAAAVLTVAGAFASVLLPTLEPYLEEASQNHPVWWTAFVAGLFVAWLVPLVISGIWSFRCIIPFRRKGRHPALDLCTHFHPAAVSYKYTIDQSESFIDDCNTLGTEGLKREVIAGILVDSHISAAKYEKVTFAIRSLAWSALFGFAYVFLSQF